MMAPEYRPAILKSPAPGESLKGNSSRSPCRTRLASLIWPATRPCSIQSRASGLTLLGRSFLIEIGRAHVCTPVTNAHLVCRLLLEKKKQYQYKINQHKQQSTY